MLSWKFKPAEYQSMCPIEKNMTETQKKTINTSILSEIDTVETLLLMNFLIYYIFHIILEFSSSFAYVVLSKPTPFHELLIRKSVVPAFKCGVI